MPTASVSHATYLAAYNALSSLADVERLAGDESLGLSYEALLSILARKIDGEVRSNISYHRRADVAQQHLDRYLRGEALTTIASSISLPPTMLVRIILETHLGVKRGKETTQLLRNPRQLLPDERLCREVANAVESDPFCGPHVDAVKRLAGLEYEALLGQKLRALGVPFLTEDALRMRGEAKTPDALLSVPLLVRGRVVHWIDSKATFGDPWSHLEYHDNQYSSYLNRFGAGLVIYWAGFDESICDSDPRVLVAHDLLADQCELMTCLAHDAAVGPGAPMPPTPTPTPPGAPSSSGASLAIAADASPPAELSPVARWLRAELRADAHEVPPAS